MVFLDRKVGCQMDGVDHSVRDLALRRYDVLVKYVSYENSVYWTRNQFFGVFSAGLLAFFAGTHDKIGFVGFVIPLLGIFVGMFWLVSAKEGEYWMRRW